MNQQQRRDRPNCRLTDTWGERLMNTKHLGDRLRRTIERPAKILFVCIMLALSAATGTQALHPIVAHAATRVTFVFKGLSPADPSHSLWTVAANWDPMFVPGTDPNREDDVLIDSVPGLPGVCHQPHFVQAIPPGTLIHGLTLACSTSSLSCATGTGGPTCQDNLTVTGTVNWTGGRLITPLTLFAGGTLNISGSGTKTLTTDGLKGAGVLNLNGTTNWSGPGPLNVGGFDGPGVINNMGIFNANPGASMKGLACCQNPSQFNNRGLFEIPDGTGTVLISFVSYNPVFHGLQASGRTVVGNGTTLELQGAPSTWSDGARFAGPGRTLIDHLANPTLQGNIFLSAGHTLELGPDTSFFNSAASLSGSGTLRGDLGNGTFVWSAGRVLGTLSVDTSVTTVVRGPVGKSLGETGIPGSGILNLAGPTFLSATLIFGGPATLNNTGTFIAEPGASMIGAACGPRFNNAGNLVNDSGSSTSAIDFIELVNTATISLTSGVLSVNPCGTPTGSPGFVEPSGATLQVAIGGTTPGTGFGQLQLSDTAQFAGNLVATNVRGFTPTPGQTFKVITCATACIGTFQLQSADYSALYHPQDVTLITRGTTDTDASAQLTDLLHAVQGVGPGTSLADKVQSAQSSLASGDVASTCSILSAFINEVNAQSGKKIPVAQADQLIADAQRIQSVLAC